jgi:YfiH family protein
MTAAVHAGWKGTKGEIAKHAVQAMVKRGAKVENILASIGPHIGMCCYSVDSDRVQYFSHMYPGDVNVLVEKNGTWHLDIGHVNYLQFIEAGILGDHIDESDLCTSCMIDEFFSYRKDTKETFGEMLGIIGWKSL